jgi:hypothetical protein
MNYNFFNRRKETFFQCIDIYIYLLRVITSITYIDDIFHSWSCLHAALPGTRGVLLGRVRKDLPGLAQPRPGSTLDLRSRPGLSPACGRARSRQARVTEALSAWRPGQSCSTDFQACELIRKLLHNKFPRTFVLKIHWKILRWSENSYKTSFLERINSAFKAL